MAYVQAKYDINDISSVHYYLTLTLEALVLKRGDELEQERKNIGSCVCDDYVSYGSTIPPGMPVAALMQFEDCVNCHDVCSALLTLSIGLRNEGASITEEQVVDYYTKQIEWIEAGNVTSKRLTDIGFVSVPVEELVEREIEKQNQMLEAVRNGRADKTVQKWWDKYNYKKTTNRG